MSAPSDLNRIGWPLDQPVPEHAPGERVVRVIEQHRNGFTVHDGVDGRRAQAPRGLVPDADGKRQRPAVGDWLLATVPDAAADDRPLSLLRLLPRRNAIRRAAAGEHYKEQILAANLDLAIVVMGLDGDYSPRRLERYLALVDSAGVDALVVLSKLDRFPDAGDRHAEIQALAGATPVLAINCKDADQVAPMAHALGPGRTGVLLGSSGAGKSTLSNTLIGHVRQKTGAVRDHDSRGRHTTTVRSLLQLPGGGCLIDSPGMRELKLTGEENLEDNQFADIEALAGQCRFRDCRHRREPGCAVRAAVEQGALDAGRLAHFQKLSEERNQAATLRQERQRKDEDKAPARGDETQADDRPGRR